MDYIKYREVIGTFSPKFEHRKRNKASHNSIMAGLLDLTLIYIMLVTVGLSIHLAQPKSNLQWDLTNCHSSWQLATKTIPVNCSTFTSIQYWKMFNLTLHIAQPDFKHNHEIGNIGAHIKYGNRMHVHQTATKADINKPIDRLYSKGLSFAHINVNGLLHKNRVDQLKIHLSNKPIDFLAISETKIDTSVEDSEVDIDGYQVYRDDRLYNGGGGVAIYVRNNPNIIYKPRPDLKDDSMECLIGEILIPNPNQLF